jgi:RNAse (barnase) inhibitor barstar
MNKTADFYEQLFADATSAGVRQLPQGDVSALVISAQKAGCLVFHVDLAKVSNKESLLNAIAKALAFPEWFGANWDALSDLLLDMAWRPATGYLVILEHADRVHANAEADFTTLAQIFNNVAETWREDGIPFWCLIDLAADEITWLPPLTQAGQ